MTSSQHILVDSTESLTSYGPRFEQPVSAEVKYVSPSENQFDAYQAASTDSLSETTAGSAAEGAGSLTMSAPTGAQAGRQYLLANGAASGLSTAPIIVTVESTSGSVVFLSEPLEAEIADSATLLGYLVFYALPATSTEGAGEGLAHWKTTYADGSFVEWSQQFRVVKNLTNQYTLTPDRLRQYFPDIDSRKFRTNSLNEVIDTGWQMLRGALDAKGMYPEKIKSWEALNWVHALACYSHLLRLQEPFDDIRYQYVLVDYQTTLNNLLEGSVQLWYDKSSTDGPRPDDHLPTLRGLGITR